MIETQTRKKRSWMPIAGVIAVLAIVAGVTVFNQRERKSDAIETSVDGAMSAASPSESTASGVDGRTGVNARTPAPAQTSQEAVQRVLAARQQERAQQRERNAREKNALLSAYRTEKANPAWAGPTEQDLRRLAADPSIAAAGIKADDVVIDCKRTTCRTRARFANGVQADDWSMLFMSSVGGILRNSVVTRTQNADGSVNLDIYSKAK